MNRKYCNVVVLISGSGSNLQKLIDASLVSNYKISAVISNRPDAFGLQRAERSNVPTRIVDHKSFESREAFDNFLANIIDEINPQLIVLAGFMRILGGDFVNRFSGKILNIHPSLLPKYPGINTHQRALDAGDTEHGVSIHFVTPDLDGGPIIAQGNVPIYKNDTAEVLAARVLEKEHLIYPKVVTWFASGRLRMHKGGAIMDNEALPPCGVIIQS